jgi:molybdenum cofactor cytidylyltransferase
MNRTAVVLLASGLSRRYGWRDKMLEDLGGRHLMDHAAGVVSALDALVKVAVCPGDRSEISDRLSTRFVLALNNKPKAGLGRSIAVGVDVAVKFKPEAVLFCMADMPFIEPWMLNDVVSRLGGMDGADIVHCGETSGVRPPTAFTSSCFNELLTLDGDDGARRIIGQGGFNVAGVSVPAPLLTDVDTPGDLDLAREQLRIRSKYEPCPPGGIVRL